MRLWIVSASIVPAISEFPEIEWFASAVRLQLMMHPIGDLYVNMARFDQAMAEDNNAIQPAPVDATVYTQLGDYNQSRTQYDQAIAAYQMATRINQNQVEFIIPPEIDRWLNSVRGRIEVAFDILKEGGRSVEYTLAHTASGLTGLRIIC